jgi:hypothetical protein
MTRMRQNQLQLDHYYHHHLLQKALTHLSHTSDHHQRQSKTIQQTIYYYQQQQLLQAFTHLFHRTKQRKRHQQTMIVSQLQRGFSLWRVYHQEYQQEVVYTQRYHILQRKRRIRQLTHAWYRFQSYLDHQQHLHDAYHRVLQVHHHHLQTRSYHHWIAHWLHTLYWSKKALQVDVDQLAALSAIQSQQLIVYSNESIALHASLEDLQCELETLQTHHETLQSQSKRQEQQLIEKQQNIHQFQYEIKELQQTIEQLEHEKKQWQLLEVNLVSQQQQLEEERQRKKLLASQRIEQLQLEHSQLTIQLSSETEQLEDETAGLENQLNNHIEQVQVVQENVTNKQSHLRYQQQQIDTIKEEQQQLLCELDSVQKKVYYTVNEGEAIREDNEKLLRHRMSEVQVLKAQSGK